MVSGLRAVSIGNLALGGTGKTPVARWTVRVLESAGYRPALLLRGYGGDETLLHARWNPSVPVVPGADRIAGAESARRDGADAVVLDDGFQHRALTRDVDLVLLAAEDPFPGRLLPVGRNREPVASLARADGVVVTRKSAPRDVAGAIVERVSETFPHLVVGRLSLGLGGWEGLDQAPSDPPDGSALVVTGVARPRTVMDLAERELGVGMELMAYPDHHAFSEDDVRAIRRAAGSRVIIVTEKDAVKLEHHAADLPSVRVMVQSMIWEQGEEQVTDLVIGGGP